MGILLAGAAVSLAACSEDVTLPAAEQSAVEVPAASETVSVYRDAHGTPHVVADSNRGVYFGYGYAVATDRLFQMEMLRRTTQGRVAQVLGEERAVCVALDEGLVFFDAGLSTRTAVAFRREMEEAFQRPTMALVLTHAHLDHLRGDAVLSDG